MDVKNETYRQRTFFQTGMPLFGAALLFLLPAICFCLRRNTFFKKRCILIFLLTLCVLLCGCHGNIIGNLMTSEHTELLVDGEYKPFNVPRNTMEALMKLVEAEDVDTIYEVFSPAVRENAEGLYEQIQEFIRFAEENVTAWDFSSGTGKGDRRDGDAVMTRASFYEFSTDSGMYRCDIGEVLKNTVQPDLVGFSDITVYPNELSWEYASKKPVGIYIVYRVEDQPQETIEGPYTMERLIELAQAGNTDGLCECFSLATKGDVEDIPEKAQELVEFLCEQMVFWEFYTWTENIEMIGGSKVTTREMFFYLHMDNGLYRCDIREVLESRDPAEVGVSSVSVFPALYPGEDPEYEDEIYKGYCTWGRDNAGISITY